MNSKIRALPYSAVKKQYASMYHLDNPKILLKRYYYSLINYLTLSIKPKEIKEQFCSLHTSHRAGRALKNNLV